MRIGGGITVTEELGNLCQRALLVRVGRIVERSGLVEVMHVCG